VTSPLNNDINIVDGEKLLDEIRDFVNAYVRFVSDHHSTVVALWILHTWIVGAFYTTPRLILDSAEPGSGKTRVLELLVLLCRNGKLTLSTTTAALYRRISAAADADEPPPTVLQDESDAVFGKATSPQTEDLRALYNAGYKRGATVDRCEGDAARMRVKEFPVFAAVAMAGLAGRMPDTITSRGITLHMRRRRPGDHLAEFRERDARAEAEPIRARIEAWAVCEQELVEARPTMPPGVRDRPAEVWEPLLAIADYAGGHWPKTARDACTHFVLDQNSDDDKMSLGQRLLRDIKEVFAAEDVTAMWSSDIIAKLTADAESEWRDLWGKPLDQRRLAKELNRYGVKSKSVRIGVATSKGYDTDGPTGLGQAWEHWLVPSTNGTTGTGDTLQVGALRTVPHTLASGTADTQAAHLYTYPDQSIPHSVPDVPLVPPTTGTSDGQSPGTRSRCPGCDRAPARADTGLCDFCTQKQRRQQTFDDSPMSAHLGREMDR
jgi:hypothetical protein